VLSPVVQTFLLSVNPRQQHKVTDKHIPLERRMHEFLLLINMLFYIKSNVLMFIRLKK